MAEQQAPITMPVPENTIYALLSVVEAGRIINPDVVGAGADVVILTLAGYTIDHEGVRHDTTTKMLFPRNAIPQLLNRFAEAFNAKAGI